jgi:hypothetical protein
LSLLRAARKITRILVQTLNEGLGPTDLDASNTRSEGGGILLVLKAAPDRLKSFGIRHGHRLRRELIRHHLGKIVKLLNSFRSISVNILTKNLSKLTGVDLVTKTGKKEISAACIPRPSMRP